MPRSERPHPDQIGEPAAVESQGKESKRCAGPGCVAFTAPKSLFFRNLRLSCLGEKEKKLAVPGGKHGVFFTVVAKGYATVYWKALTADPRIGKESWGGKKMKSIASYARYYSEPAFLQKLAKAALKAGKQLVRKALCLYFAALAPETPAWAKAVMLGALGYFILPLDLIPDAIPGIGYADDLGVVLAAAATVSAHITDEHRRRADETLARWFGISSSSEESTSAEKPRVADLLQ
jgi:uncharacterized membrane protein YkvA (DUF1232 family)